MSPHTLLATASDQMDLIVFHFDSLCFSILTIYYTTLMVGTSAHTEEAEHGTAC